MERRALGYTFEDGPLTPLNVYADFIERICKRIKLLFPEAKVVFATSTRVLEEKFTRPEISIRRNSTVNEYNKVAVNIAKKYGFGVNDLFSLTKDLDESYYSDMTHLYTEKGEILMLEAVLNVVNEALNLNVNIDCERVVKEDKDSIEVVGQ